MNRRLLRPAILLSISCIGSAAALAAAVQVRKTLLPRPAEETAIEVAARAASASGSTAPVATKEVPRAETVETVHDFGVLESLRDCEHSFAIRNLGRAPLVLKQSRTTCKCTVGELPPDPIPPGGEGHVRLKLELAEKTGRFSHGAEIATNDPKRKSITLRVTGTIPAFVSAAPAGVYRPVWKRGEKTEAKVSVYSQVWPRFTIAKVESSLEGLQWTVEPERAGALRSLEARSGYCLRLVFPADLPVGDFAGAVQLKIAGPDPAEPPRTLPIAFGGRVPGTISVFGRKFERGRGLCLGAIDSQTGVREHVLLKVRDRHRKLAVRRVEVEPAFLNVRVGPARPEADELGLYRIDVEVPQGAPAANYLGRKKGTIRIETDHPAVPVVNLNVEFAVIGS